MSPNWNKSKLMGKTDPDPIQPFASTQDTVFLCIIIWAKRPKKGEKIRQLLQGTKMRKAGNSCFKLRCPLKRNYFNKNYMSSNHWLRGTCSFSGGKTWKPPGSLSQKIHPTWIFHGKSWKLNPQPIFTRLLIYLISFLWNYVTKILYAQQLTFHI